MMEIPWEGKDTKLHLTKGARRALGRHKEEPVMHTSEDRKQHRQRKIKF